MAEYKRGGTASMIVASVCNEHRNSDLLASDAGILCAFNEELDAARAQGRGEGLEEKLQERKRQEMILWREVFVAAFKEDVAEWIGRRIIAAEGGSR